MEVWHAVAVMSAGMLKFLFAPVVSYQLGHDYWQTALLTFAGGALGAVIFFRGSRQVLEWLRLRSLRRRRRALAQGKRTKRIFTRTNRMIVRVKWRYGLNGLVFILTPFLSIPVTAVLAAKYFRHNDRALPSLLISVGLWSLVLSGLWRFME